MKNKLLMKGLVACGVAFGLVCAASAQQKAGFAKVVRKQGEARYNNGNSVWLPVKVGDVYGPGTVIQTEKAKGSYVDLVLGSERGVVGVPSSTSTPSPAPVTANMSSSYSPKTEQNLVRVWENTALGIDGLSSTQTGADSVSDTQLDLKSGHIFGSVKKMSAGSKYEIKLPNGVAGIRGTSFDLWSTGLFRIGNGSGVISVVGSDNQPTTHVVPGGSEFDPSSGNVNPLPKDVVDALNRLEQGLRLLGAPGVVGFAPDHTIYRVSNTHGHHHGQGNEP